MILSLISKDKNVFVGVTNGTEILASANDLFSYISPDFKNWGRDKVERTTSEVMVDVYEQIEDATYPKIFGSVDENLDRLVMTTPQIKYFVANLAKNYLLNAEWTCFRFLFKVNNELFVADARVHYDSNRDLRVTRFLDGSIRHAKHHHRIVIPQFK
jgi:hypothetical protein